MSPRAAAALAPAVATTGGLALLVAHPPVGWWWTSFAAPALLLAALHLDAHAAGATGRPVRGLRLGAVLGLVAYGPMISWLIAPAGLVGWGLLTLVQAGWMALLGWLLSRVLEHPWLALITAVLWTGIDAWRGLVPLNGFGWGALAYAHVDGSWLLPTARLVGGRGITLLVVLIGTAGYLAARTTWQGARAAGDRDLDRAMATARVPFALLVGGLLVSVLAIVEPPATDGELDVLVVQGNDIRHWEAQPPDPPLTITTAQRDLTLAAVAADGPPQLTVWPESSIDRDPFTPRGSALGALADEAARAAGTLVAGASLDGPDPATQRLIAALHLEDGLVEVDRYVKRRLVPFGEFVPLRRWLDWFPPLDQVPRDAQPGEGPQQLVLADGTRLAVIICFETLFTEVVRSNVRGEGELAHVVLSLTNDASFRDTAEPAQHLAQSRLRAVETGRTVVHAALSGASAIVTPDGEVRHETPVFTQATIRASVPLATGPTPFLVIGDLVGGLTRAATLLWALWLVWLAWGRRSGAGPAAVALSPARSGRRVRRAWAADRSEDPGASG